MKNNIDKLQQLAIRFQKALKTKGFVSEYKVKNIWLDYGAGLRGETIVVEFKDRENKLDSFQILSLRDLRELKEDNFADQDFYRLLNKHVDMFTKFGWGKEPIQ